MNQSQRESILATHEDDALDKYLDDNNRCEICLMMKVYMEYNEKYICQSCYESACEQAEMMEENRKENEL